MVKGIVEGEDVLERGLTMNKFVKLDGRVLKSLEME